MINFDQFDLNEKIEKTSNFSFSGFGMNTLLGCKIIHKKSFQRSFNDSGFVPFGTCTTNQTNSKYLLKRINKVLQ